MKQLNAFSELKPSMFKDAGKKVEPVEVKPKSNAALLRVADSGGQAAMNFFGIGDTPVLDPSLIGKEFEHFKGKRYKLVGYAKHSETLEPHVVYQQLYGQHELWVRPAKMFFEHISRDGYSGPRFRVV